MTMEQNRISKLKIRTINQKQQRLLWKYEQEKMILRSFIHVRAIVY